MTTQTFPKTPLNTVKRMPERGKYDKENIYPIIDASPICHVGFVQDGQPFVIPTIHGRIGDTLVLHGAKASRLLKHVASGEAVCLTFTLLDGIVLARSVFHHSMNYRSATVFGRGRLIEAEAEKMAALAVVSEHLLAGRWQDARPPSPLEMNATSVVEITIESASAKSRSGPPKDDDEDYALPVWAGVLAIEPKYALVADSKLSEGIEPAEYLRKLIGDERLGD